VGILAVQEQALLFSLWMKSCQQARHGDSGYLDGWVKKQEMPKFAMQDGPL
jgi:hypothetical protein